MHPGAGESGKSTILKQMRLIYTKEGFSKQEKEEWRCIIFNNVLDSLRIIVNAMEEFKFAFQNESTRVSLVIHLCKEQELTITATPTPRFANERHGPR